MSMRKTLTTLLVAFALLSPAVAVPGQATAANVFQPCAPGSKAANTSVCQDARGSAGTGNPIIKIIKTAIIILSFLIGIGAVIGIVVSGFRMIIAGGDSQAVASARTALIYSLAGLAVAILAQAIVAFVLDKL